MIFININACLGKKLVLRGVITSPDIRRATNIRWLGLGIGYQGMWVSALQEIRRHSPYPLNVPPIATLTYYSSSALESTDMELGAELHRYNCFLRKIQEIEIVERK